jgi:hypothetical protein
MYIYESHLPHMRIYKSAFVYVNLWKVTIFIYVHLRKCFHICEFMKTTIHIYAHLWKPPSINVYLLKHFRLCAFMKSIFCICNFYISIFTEVFDFHICIFMEPTFYKCIYIDALQYMHIYRSHLSYMQLLYMHI